MKYIRVWKNRCVVARHYERYSLSNFHSIVGEVADRILEHEYFDIDEFDKYENRFCEIADKIVAESRTEHGYDCGDFILYIRDDDFDIYDIKIED